MNPLIRNLGAGLTAVLALLAVGCNQSENDSPTASNPVHDLSPAAALATPKAVASIALGEGHAIEFYDFGNDVMISETGKAGTEHFFKEQNTPSALLKRGVDHAALLAEVWKSAAPNAAFPQSLKDIQTRWKTTPMGQTPATRSNPVSHEASGQPLGQSVEPSMSLAKTAAASGCNNGCCDYQWLSTFSQCHVDYDYKWFLYNYGWSYANSSSVMDYDGMVCAATGNSQYTVHMGDGKGGSWTVPPATYRTYWWDSGLGFNHSMNSTVNSSTNPHLHTYCGGVFY